MNNAVIRVSLDVNKAGSQVNIPMFQGDTKRTIVFSLTESGKPYKIKDCIVAFTGKKADGNFLNNACTINHANQTIIYALNENESNMQTTTCVGEVECQLVIQKQVVVDGKTMLQPLACPYFTITVNKKVYNEEEIMNSEVVLSFLEKLYVPLIRKIAGCSLTDNISVSQLREALFYPILESSKKPTSGNHGEIGQFWIRKNNDLESLYMCIKQNLANETNPFPSYEWIEFPLTSNVVPIIRKIAGLELNEDITASQLNKALSVYPLISTSVEPTRKTVGSIGQFYLCTTYDGVIYTYKLYYCSYTNNGDYNWVCIYDSSKVTSGGVTGEQIQNAVDNYFDENPIRVEGIDELQLYSYATRVQNAQNQNTLTLAFMADTHYCDNDNNAQEKLDTAKTMGLLSHYADIDAIINLGDMVNGNETKDETRVDLFDLMDATTQNAKCPVFYARGNHDDNGLYSYEGVGTYQPNEIINETEWCDYADNDNLVVDVNHPNGGYGYFDNEKSKIRVFLLNSSDIPYVLKADGSYRYNGYCCYAFSNEQLNFVANALQFEDKENPNKWAAMFLTHIPLDTTNDNGYRFGTPDALIRGHAQLLSIINAYRKGISYSFNGAVNNSSLGELAEDFNVSVNVDYSSKGVGDVICFVCGHTHTDNVSQRVGKEGSLSHGYTYLGIVGGTCFATMVVNREENTVSVFKYGKVVTPSDATHNSGAINGEAEFDIDMSVGTWVVPFEQFRPTNKNLFNGMSDLWGDGYNIDTTATLDTTTLELSNATVYSAFALSKGVPIKASTQYEIPNSSGFIINCFTANGKFNGTITATDGILTTKSSGGYLVFAFHKFSYPDYENFYIREVVAETPDEDVEYVTVEDFNNAIGDINTALDSIIAVQENLIGGATE